MRADRRVGAAAAAAAERVRILVARSGIVQKI
jgi:hypothetical protein